jgi:hypothetical protein
MNRAARKTLLLELSRVFAADAKHVNIGSWTWDPKINVKECHPAYIASYFAHEHDEVTGTPRLMAISAEIKRRADR